MSTPDQPPAPSNEGRQDEFLATLGHELRNPLGAIANSLEILKLSGVFEQANTAQACAVMERQVRHLCRLVDDLLEVSRITRGVVEIRKEPLDLKAVLKASIDAMRPLLNHLQHRIEIDLDAGPIPIDADAVRLGQVFTNLLNNAATYSNDGGVVTIAARRDHDAAVVSIRDSGIGIAAHHLPQVFDLFMQADRSTRRAQGGLGIGLTLARSLVQLHGGTIDARSEGLGMGSEFLIRLPLRQQPHGEVAANADKRSLPRRRILIVDDSRDGGESLAMLLRVLGAEVALAHTGHDALEGVNTFRPDVVLLDIGMPGMDGYEVARRIRANPANRHMQLIALTGWGQDEDRQRSAAAGFNHHLVKPADVDQLRQLLSVA